MGPQEFFFFKFFLLKSYCQNVQIFPLLNVRHKDDFFFFFSQLGGAAYLKFSRSFTKSLK